MGVSAVNIRLKPLHREKYCLLTENIKMNLTKMRNVVQTAEVTDIINAPEKFSSRTNVDRGHTLIEYENILKNGLAFYRKQIDEELQKYPRDEYLLSMKDTLSDVVNFIKRIADEIDKKSVKQQRYRENAAYST